MHAPAGKRPLYFFTLIGLALIWGSSFILMSRGMKAPDETAVLSPIHVAALRMFFAGMVLLPFVRPALRSIRPADWKWVAVVGICGSGGPAFMFTYALQHIESSVGGMLNALTPLFTLLIGLVVFKLKVAPRHVAGVLLGLIGAISLLSLVGNQSVDRVGWALLAVLATLCYGISVNVIQFKLRHVPALHLASFSLLIVAIPCGIVAGMSDAPHIITTHWHGWASLGYVFLLGAIGSAMANIIFFWLTNTTSALFAASVTYLIPLVAVGWGVADDEPLTVWHLVCGLIILAGVWMVRKRK